MQGGMTSAVPFWPVMKDLIAGFKLSRAGVLSFLKPTLGWPTAVVCEAPVYLGVLFENQFEAVKRKCAVPGVSRARNPRHTSGN